MKKQALLDHFTCNLNPEFRGWVGAEVETHFVDSTGRPISLSCSQEIFRGLERFGWKVSVKKSDLITELKRDEEKILYLDKNDKYQIYDLKAKKSFTLPDLPDLLNLSWYSASNHLLITQNPPAGGLISIIESDGTNKMTVFTGKFENGPPAGGVFPHPSATSLIILTTLTQQEGSLPNLYSVNLK